MSTDLLTPAWDTVVDTVAMKCVLMSLVDHYNDKTKLCYPGRERLAKHTCMTPESVSRNIKKLEKAGLISIERNVGDGAGAKSNRYTLHLGQSDGKSHRQSDFKAGQCDLKAGQYDFKAGQCDGNTPEPLLTFTKPLSNPEQNGSYNPESAKLEMEKSREGNQEEKAKEQFNHAWGFYPQREGGNSETAAYREWQKLIGDGYSVDEITAGVIRYFTFCEAKNRIGTQYVLAATRFFSDLRFKDDWAISKPESRTTLPEDDTQLQAWATEHGFGIAPVGMTYPQYRQHLKGKVDEANRSI